MEEYLEILKYILPAVVVLASNYFIVKHFFQKDESKRRFELKYNNQKIISPIRLQAYERMILFLERITPESLVVRTQSVVMNNAQLQRALLASIRKEFEHNMSQQIYITGESWEAIKNAKESIVKLINTAASKQDSKAPATHLSSIIIKMYASIEESPIDVALNKLKDEVHEEIL